MKRTTRAGKLLQTKNKGRFKKKCSCLVHEENSSRVCPIDYGKSVDKSISNTDIQYLISRNLLRRTSTSVCKECLLRYADNGVGVRSYPLNKVVEANAEYDNNNKNDLTNTNGENNENDLVNTNERDDENNQNDLRNTNAGDNENNEDVNKEDGDDDEDVTYYGAIDLPMELRKQMKQDIRKLYNSGFYRNINSLLNYDPGKWLSERPLEIVSFFKKLCQFDDEHSSNFKLAQIIETFMEPNTKN